MNLKTFVHFTVLITSFLTTSLALADEKKPECVGDCILQAVPNYVNTHFKDISLTGYIDTSYNYLTRSQFFTNFVQARAFDVEPNGFTLQQFAFTLSYLPKEGIGGLANIIIGRDAYSTFAYGWDPYFGSQTLGIDPYQAYLQFACDKWTLIVGKFAVLLGEEATDNTKNWLFSHSYLFWFAEPGGFLGFRLSYAQNKKITYNIGLNDGWTTIRDSSKPISVEAGVTVNFTDEITLVAQLTSGGQRADGDFVATGPMSRRHFISLTATDVLTKEFTVAASYDFGIQNKAIRPSGAYGTAIWHGLALYSNYLFCENWNFATRAEIFTDPQGFRTGIEQTLEEVTLVLGYMPCKHLDFRLETRHDFASVPSFLNKDHIKSNRNQQSYALEGLYTFG